MKIDSLDKLRNEKIRLRLELRELEDLLHDDLQWAIEEMKPVNIISRAVANIFQSKNQNILNDSIGTAIGFMMKKIFLNKSSWIFRLIVPLLIKNMSSNYIGEHKEGILSSVKNLIRKMKSPTHRGNGHFDQSTAESHY